MRSIRFSERRSHQRGPETVLKITPGKSINNNLEAFLLEPDVLAVGGRCRIARIPHTHVQLVYGFTRFTRVIIFY